MKKMKQKFGFQKSFLIFLSQNKKQGKKARDKQINSGELMAGLSVAFFAIVIFAFILNAIFEVLHNDELKFNQKENWGIIKTVQAQNLEFQAEIEKWTDYLDLEEGQEQKYSLLIKNTGQNTWPQGRISLETGPFLNSKSEIEHSSWLKYFQVALIEKDILPGQEAKIDFVVKAPLGIYSTIQEDFQLVYNNRPIAGSTFRLFVSIKQKEKTKETAPTQNFTKEIKEEKKSSEVLIITQIKNQTETAKEVLTKPKFIGVPPFFKDSQKEDSGEKIVLETKEEAKAIPAVSFEKNEANHNQANFESDLKYLQEPTIRVGLFNSKNAQRVSSNYIYDVYSGESILFSGLPAGYVLIVSYDHKTSKYVVSTPGFVKFATEKIRLVPRNGEAVMTLWDYENRPAWNKNLNDNQYRNIIEFNYSKATNRFWVINELPINYYLKGITETTNYSPVEYQKVIATAARTYVMYHYNRGLEYNLPGASTKHGYDNFHVDATFDQVYKGYGSEIRLSRLSQAVDETYGMVVTYDDKIVVTPYFSRSDGRTRSWEEVWYGDPKPWLSSVPVPQDDGRTLWGHGVGMSAQGALIMVRDQGQKWDDTLKYFYQGIELKKVY